MQICGILLPATASQQSLTLPLAFLQCTLGSNAEIATVVAETGRLAFKLTVIPHFPLLMKRWGIRNKRGRNLHYHLLSSVRAHQSKVQPFTSSQGMEYGYSSTSPTTD